MGIAQVQDREFQGRANSRERVTFPRTYTLVLLFLIAYFARPEDWIPGVHYLHLAKVLGIVAILAFFTELSGARQKWPREVIFLFLLVGQMFLTVPFSSVWKGGAFHTTRAFANVVPMILVISLAVNTLGRLRRILFWQVASVAVVATVAIIKFRHAQGRLEGVLNGIYSNPNDLALIIDIAIPICLVFMLRSKNNLIKVSWLGCIGVMTYAVVLSASRSGILAFVLIMTLALWHFSVKGRYRYLVVVFGGLAVCALVIGGHQLKTRFEAMSNPELNESAYESAQQRDMLLKKSIAMTFEHPLFGVGPGNFDVTSGVWRVTHNTYTQISSETGLPGFVLYIMILCCAWTNLGRAKRLSRGDGQLNMFAGAIQASFVGFLFGSFFASEGYQYFTYFLIAYTTAVYRIAKTRHEAAAVPISTAASFRPENTFQEQRTRGAVSAL